MFSRDTPAISYVMEHEKVAKSRGFNDLYKECAGFKWAKDLCDDSKDLKLKDFLVALNNKQRGDWSVAALYNTLHVLTDDLVELLVTTLSLGHIKILLENEDFRKKLSSTSIKYIVSVLEESKSIHTLEKHKWLIQDG